MFAEGGDLLVDGYLSLFTVHFIARYYNNGLFGKNSRALGNIFDCDETFSFPRHILKAVNSVTCRARHFRVLKLFVQSCIRAADVVSCTIEELKAMLVARRHRAASTGVRPPPNGGKLCNILNKEDWLILKR